MDSRGKNFKVQRNCANTGKILSSLSFHGYFQVFYVNCNICLRHLMLLKLMGIFETDTKTFAIQRK